MKYQYKYVPAILIVLLFSPNINVFSCSTIYGQLLKNQTSKYKSIHNNLNLPVKLEAQKQKIDGYSRILLNSSEKKKIELSKKLDLSIRANTSGQLIADVFIQLKNVSAFNTLSELGVEVRTQVGNILVASAPVDVLSMLIDDPNVKRVEISKKRYAKLDSSRVAINADLVQQGYELPQEYQGKNVIMGIIDSGIDFNHPDFSNENGSRILYLLEFTADGGQKEWTKNDIDNRPESITQIDGNGNHGHGTHVAGIAAGGGKLNAAMTGIAPASDIIFVKAVRDQESYGGYADADVVAGCQYIFEKAGELGKPAVVNISIGSHSGPHDGTSLYEQALSKLAGPGKIIVSAAGNEGNKYIHAGGTSLPNILNETFVIADSLSQYARITLWYDSGSLDGASVFAYDNQFNFIAQSSIQAVTSETPIVFNNDTLGFVAIDGSVTSDPNNGDGNVNILIENLNHSNIDISGTIWSIGTMGSIEGRIDLWAVSGCSFYNEIIGFQGETEMPGNNEYSVGIPATAKKVISVGSYTTKNSWFDLDGDSLWITTKPIIGARALSSSIGPTRDGRISPDITAPGEIIFSALSSDLTEGLGYQPNTVLLGGGYSGKVGTSFSSPHVAGTIALMLQEKNDLTYEQIIQIFSETARVNQYTGEVPNNYVGMGYLDAYAAVKYLSNPIISVERNDKSLPESFLLKQNYPNPFNPSTNIEYIMASNAKAVLRIYNVIGEQIKTLVNETQNAGFYTIQWNGITDNGLQAASGIYYLKFQADSFIQTKKMVLIR